LKAEVYASKYRSSDEDFSVQFLHRYSRKMSQSFYDFKAVNLKGEEVSFSKYKGKVVLIENVASL